jgi:hypothetical protein
MVRGVCSVNGHVLPEASIPEDRAKDISGRTGPIGKKILRQGDLSPKRVSEVMIRVGEQVVHGKTFLEGI